MKKKIRFIINPKSGVGKKHGIADLINRLIDQEKFDSEMLFTNYPKHGTALSKEAADKNYFAVISVGGDGSVNEVAKGVTGTKTILGVIPAGSGNGMARHLKIPMQPEKAIEVINQCKIESIDTVRVNEEFCISTIGIGFDAHIAHLFSHAPKRGYSTYAKLVFREFSTYQPEIYRLTIDGQPFEKECFLITFANCSQFGNNAVIAPFADVRDGIIDISLLKKFPFTAAPLLVYRLMNNRIHKSKYFSMLKGKNIVLENHREVKGHIDGEPILFNSDIHIQIIPRSLNVFIP